VAPWCSRIAAGLAAIGAGLLVQDTSAGGLICSVN
jgi:hypothetical protein